MKLLMLTLVIVLCHTQSVNSSFYAYLSDKLSEMANSFAITVRNIKNTIKSIFQPRFISAQSLSHQLEPPDVEIKRTFNPYVEEISQNDTEISEYIKLRSEPTALMTTPQLAMHHGRQVESHVIHTLDGYMLTIHRMLPTPNVTSKFSNRTIILHHGLLGSSADWILLGPQNSLPYLLCDAGYDVWLANARGNDYSRGHLFRKTNSMEYWKFSWQEIGKFDLAALIDHIRKTKNLSIENKETIDFIGHSMGATALLVLLSSQPQYNQYLRIGILLAPLAFMTNVEGPLKSMMPMAISPPDHLLKLIGDREFVPSRFIPKRVALKYCKGPFLFCSNPLYFLTGGIPTNLTYHVSFLATLLYHVPAGGSTNTILHYAQLAKTGKFHSYNAFHSEFALRDVTVPIVLFSSDGDWLGTVPDVLRLYFSIANPIDHYVIRGKNFSHTEFVWGLEARHVVFDRVLEYLDKGLNMFQLNSNELYSVDV